MTNKQTAIMKATRLHIIMYSQKIKAYTLYIIVCTCLCVAAPCAAQKQYRELYKSTQRIDIPFELQNNFIVLNISYEGIFPLRFIFDTGAEHTIITKKEIPNLLNTAYYRTITLYGADMRSKVQASIAKRVRLDLPNITIFKNVLVLDEDIFQFDKFSGMEIQGILGVEAFAGFVVRINYARRLLSIYPPSVFDEKKFKNYEKIPIDIFQNKPYINALTYIKSDTAQSLRMLLDTGADLAVMFQTDERFDIGLPEHTIKGNIGNGLGGVIEGVLGRIHNINIGNTPISTPISHFQTATLLYDSTLLHNRQGIIGGEILSRFDIIFDFNQSVIYTKPNKRFKKAFEYDRSGISLVAIGAELNRFLILDVVENSPAALAGVQEGDEIVKVGIFPARFYKMATITQKFHKKVGKKVRITVKRNQNKYKIVFRLKNIL